MWEVALIQIFCTLPFFLAFTVFMISYGYLSHTRRKKAREELLNEYNRVTRSENDPYDLIPIRYSDEDLYRKLMKFFPWRGAGWLISGRNDIIFLSKHNSDLIIKKYPRSRTDIEWISKRYFRNGALYWFRLKLDGKNVYYTSETGTFIFGSHKSTYNIYSQLSE